MEQYEEQGFRMESDLLGKKEVPKDAYYGIHTIRALENFTIGRKVNMHLIYAMATVKKAAAMTHEKLGNLPSDITQAIIAACDEVMQGLFDNEFVVDAYQGGAGTSTNMNVNEVIANRALELAGFDKGRYDIIHPIHHVNYFQSTNDVYPTALRIASIKLLRPLSEAFALLQESLQQKENEFNNILKLGRTQLMDAVPMMAGQSFGAYAQGIARDRWRLYKVEERLRQINIGGTAIGTGMNASRKYIYTITDIIQELTGLGLARSEFAIDITQNMDVFAEVSGLLKAAAVNLFKISSDLRLLSSGPEGGIGELILPAMQAGSSIMPGKINPVIPEMVGQTAIKVIANDNAVTAAAMNGQLELNAFMPLIAESLLESLEIMTKAVLIFKEKCIDGIHVNENKCEENLERSRAAVTALVCHIGYDKASEVAKISIKESKSISQVLLEKNILSEEKINKILNPFEITKPGIPGA